MSVDTQKIGNDAWENLRNQAAFIAEVPKETFFIFEKFVKGFPEVAKDLMTQPVTITTAAEAKLQFLEYSIKEGFAKQYADATGQGEMMNMLLGMMEGLIESLVDQVRNNDLVQTMEDQGVTLEQILATWGVTEDASKMNIAELFSTFPIAIVKNT